MVKAGLRAIYLSGWQVAADANLVRSHLPGSEPLSGELGTRARQAHQQRPPARRPDLACGGRRLHVLAGADRRRRRGRLRRAAERVRADECLHRGRRRGGALRGSALLGEEVRSPRRQGPRAHVTVRPHARRRTTGGGCGARADRWSSRGRTPSPPRCSRATSTMPTVCSARASARQRASTASATASKRRSPAGSRTPRTPTSSGSRPRRPTCRRPSASRRRSTSASPASWLAYNCSPSFNWRKHLNDAQIAGFQRDLARLGYRFQFITLAGFHSLNLSMFELARGYRDEG